MILIFGVLILFVSNSKANSQIGLNFDVGIGYNVNFGDFGNFYKNDITFETYAGYYLSFLGVDITLGFSYNRFKFNNSYFNYEMNRIEPGTSIADNEWTCTAIPLMLGIRYIVPNKYARPYVTLEFGIHFMKYNERVSESYTILTNPGVFNLPSEPASGTNLGGALCMGFLIPVSTNVSLDFGMKFHYIRGEFAKTFTIANLNNDIKEFKQRKNIMFLALKSGINISF
ncbi:MAG: hypothetical protein FJ216_00945 [Ignavibacteria bacterium]|nr:hypothetical protein [Ignavibacteria bacterium]